MECFSNLFKRVRETENRNRDCKAGRWGTPCTRVVPSHRDYCEEHDHQRRLNCSVFRFLDDQNEAFGVQVRQAVRKRQSYEWRKCFPRMRSQRTPGEQLREIVCERKERPNLRDRVIGELGLMTDNFKSIEDEDGWQETFDPKIEDVQFNFTKVDINLMYFRALKTQNRLGFEIYHSMDTLPLEYTKVRGLF